MRLKVKVIPGAAQTQVVGWLGDVLKIRIQAVPENGKANLALRKLVGDALQINCDQVQIVSGCTHARKTLEISGLTEQQVFEALQFQDR